jgi:hypothetical protein
LEPFPLELPLILLASAAFLEGIHTYQEVLGCVDSPPLGDAGSLSRMKTSDFLRVHLELARATLKRTTVTALAAPNLSWDPL